MNVYLSQYSNATMQLTAMKTITECYLWSLGPVWDVKFSGSARVVTCGEDGTIRIWDSWSSHCVAVLTGHLGAVLSISLRQITGLCRFLNNLRLVMFSLCDQVISLFVSHYCVYFFSHFNGGDTVKSIIMQKRRRSISWTNKIGGL